MPTLVLVDIQKEYTTEGRPFYLKGIGPSLSNCKKILSFAREQAWEIMHVQHSNGYEAPKFNPGEPFFQFESGFEPLDGEKHYIKNDFSCYSNAEFSKKMEEISLPDNKIYMVGYNSVMCCLSTLEEARRRKHTINFIADASLAKDIGIGDEEETHKSMLKIYQAKALARVIKTDDVVLQFSMSESSASSSNSGAFFHHKPNRNEPQSAVSQKKTP